MLFTHRVHTASSIRHTGCIQPAPPRHTGCIQPPSQDTRGAYSKAHKTHGVHTATPTGPYSHPHKTHICFHAQAMQYELVAANSPRGSILLVMAVKPSRARPRAKITWSQHAYTYFIYIYIYIYILDSHMAPDGACGVAQSTARSNAKFEAERLRKGFRK